MILIACYSPSIIKKSYDSITGEVIYKFLGKANNETLKRERFGDLFDRDFIHVPCGNCIGCRLDYASTWADRLFCESLDKPSVFLTLTYNDEFLPLFDEFSNPTIRDEHLSLFIVALRNKFRNIKVRYAMASEYGDQSCRPHYHLILYNIEFDDLKPQYYKLNNLGQPMYTSSLIEELWSYGFNCLEEACYESMAYTARYILKKQKGQGSAVYDAFNIEPPKFRMSRRPGLAYDWIINNYHELYEQGYIPFDRSVLPSGKLTPNRYFDKVVSVLDPKLFSHYKRSVESKSNQFFFDKYNNSSMSMDKILDYYEFERENFLKKVNFHRDLS